MVRAFFVEPVSKNESPGCFFRNVRVNKIIQEVRHARDFFPPVYTILFPFFIQKDVSRLLLFRGSRSDLTGQGIIKYIRR